MANFNENQIQGMLRELRDELNPDVVTRELALLELEDMKRKGCVLEYACRFDQCRACSMSDKCPVIGWEKRHPEYVNDELATKIKILEAGGEEAYKAQLKAQEEAKRKLEEEKNKATDEDRVNAAKKILKLYFESKMTASDAINAIANALDAKSKSDFETAKHG